LLKSTAISEGVFDDMSGAEGLLLDESLQKLSGLALRFACSKQQMEIPLRLVQDPSLAIGVQG
jgi:hypothetical protein